MVNRRSEVSRLTPYIHVLRAPGAPAWLLVTVFSRLAVASVPLGCVFLAKHYLGSYATGALLAGAYAAGEALAAPRMGARFHSRPLGRELRIVLALEALLLTLMTLAVYWRLTPAAVVIVLFAGVVASGAPGALRTVAGNITSDRASTALGLDSAVSQAMFMVGPALAASVATAWDPVIFLPAISVGLILSLPAISRIPEPIDDSDRATAHTPLRKLGPVMLPGVVASIAVMGLVATHDTTIPGQLDNAGLHRGLAGPLLAALAGSSIISSLVYGSRNWRGDPANHAMLASLAFALAITINSYTSSLIPLVLGIAVAGACQAPALTARNLSISRTISRPDQPAAYSVLYASGGIGYTLSSIYIAATINALGPSRAQTTCAVAVSALIVIAWFIEIRRRAAPAGERERAA